MPSSRFEDGRDWRLELVVIEVDHKQHRQLLQVPHAAAQAVDAASGSGRARVLERLLVYGSSSATAAACQHLVTVRDKGAS